METEKSIGAAIGSTSLAELSYRPEVLTLTEDGKKAIAAMNGQKLRDMADRDCFLEVQKMMKHIASQVGCGIPSGEQDFRKAALRMMQHLTGYYGDLTSAEVKTAFDLFSAGRLDQYFQQGLGGNREKPKHYGQLSPSYVSEVLNAYQVVRGRAMYVQEMTRPVAYVSRITPDERMRNDAQCRQWMCEAYDEWLVKGEVEYPTMATARVYRDILVNDGWASKDTRPDDAAVTEGFIKIQASGRDVREAVIF